MLFCNHCHHLSLTLNFPFDVGLPEFNELRDDAIDVVIVTFNVAQVEYKLLLSQPGAFLVFPIFQLLVMYQIVFSQQSLNNMQLAR